MNSARKKKKSKSERVQILKAMPQSENAPINYWADFWELQCFFSKDQLYSLDELLNCFGNDHVGDDIEDEMEPFGNEILKDETIIGKNLMGVLLYRKHLFGGHYPFVINEKFRSISSRKILKENHKLYLSLLLSSNISLIRPRRYHEWTTKFELFCSEKFKSLLPASSKFLNCGPGNVKTSSRRSRLIKDLFLKVSQDMRINTTPEFDNMSKNRRGDMGVDLIGYARVPQKDLCDRGGSIAFAQCACGRNWIPKQREVLGDVLGKFFQFRSSVMSVIFTPHSFRTSQGTWEKAEQMEHVMIIDRFRFFYPGNVDRSKQLFKKYYRSLFNQILTLDVED